MPRKRYTPQEIYDMAIADGTSPKMAEALAGWHGRGFNLGMTDTKYFASFKSLGDELHDEHLTSVVSSARNHGYEPSRNDVYMPELARFEGDPEAFVSPTHGRQRIKDVCESRGAINDGGLHFHWPKPTHDPLAPENREPLGDDIIRAGIREIIEENPDAAKEPLETVKAEVIKRRSPRS